MSVLVQSIAFLPLLVSAALFVGVFQQGEMRQAASNPWVWTSLAAVALLGTLSSWRMTRSLSAALRATVAAASDGYVALEGVARPLPEHALLSSPNGKPCVWFHYRHSSGTGKTRSYTSKVSSAPFLLVDPTGECVIDPAGAALEGGADADVDVGSETLIRDGDPVYVVGQFARSPRGAGGRPTISAPKTGQVFLLISEEGGPEDRRGWYRLLLYLDAAILALSVAALLWLRFAALPRQYAAIDMSARSPEAVQRQLERDTEALRQYTVRVKGTIVRVDRIDFKPPQYVLVCKARRPGKSVDEEFQTDNFLFEPDRAFVGRTVDVYLDPDGEPGAYHVPSGPLMKEMLDRQKK